MTSPLGYVRHGFGTIRPYIFGYPELLGLVEKAFGADVLEKLDGPGGFHVEARIGDSVIVLELSSPPPPGGAPGFVYVYVPDVDAAYQRALDAGARSSAPPEDKPYDERAAAVIDAYGNTWYLATYRREAQM